VADLISLANYKAYAGITGTAQDAQLTALIAQASALIRRLCGRDLANGFELTSRTEDISGSGLNTLRVREWPITTIASISYVDANGTATEIDSTAYRIVPNGYGLIGLLEAVNARYATRFDYSYSVTNFGWVPNWRKSIGNVRVVYTGGFSPIPLDLQSACMQAVGAMQASAGTRGSFQSESLGAYSYTRGTIEKGGVMATIAALIAPWRVGP